MAVPATAIDPMISVWCRGSADQFMPEAIVSRLGDQVRRHPWWRARARLIIRLLGELGVSPPVPVLDAGCGWGSTLIALEQAGYQAVGLDVSRAALERLDQPGRTLIEADLTRPWVEVASNIPFTAVLALDVIEHLDDDQACLRQLAGLVAPAGRLVVSVPALPELYSEFDEVQGHRRRYTPDRLRKAFDTSGLEVDRVFWWGQWLVPLFARRGRKAADRDPTECYLDHLKLPPWPAPWLIERILALEEPWALAGKLGRGTSLVAVASRSE